jgi:zinc/manganese transport system substrate-binding protein
VPLTSRVIAALTAAAFALSGCAASAAPSGSSGADPSTVIQVVAAENFWGSIATQLGGTHAQVTSIIVNPDADPHNYEPTAADARIIASADLVLVNGVGYDPWAAKVIASNATPKQTVLTVGDLLGVSAGGNPHRWYNPADVKQVVAQITADYQAIDPANTDYFAQQKVAFETRATSEYNAVIADIKAKYAGTQVGASESIFAMIAPALGLDLITPPTFLKAISEGTDPTVSDKTTIDEQIKTKQIKVYVYNSQNATPDIQTQIAEAKAAGIPVTTITETLTPAIDTWQQWQTAQLVSLQAALAKGAGQ